MDLDEFAERAAEAGALVVPLAFGVLAASPEPYWLDSPEFTAAAQTLGMPHPPGHPLYVMLAKPFTLLPIGGIAFRVAVASAAFGAAASFLLFRLAVTLARRAAPTLSPRISAAICLGAVLLVSTAPGWWFQCVRAEVYSLEILLVVAALYAVVLYCLGGASDERLLLAAAFAFGLGLANHHFVMLCALPAAVPALVALFRARGGSGAARVFGRMALATLAGLLPYAFLPIRSAAGAALALGGVRSLSDFLWVVSAKVYQKSMMQEHAAGLSERSMETLFAAMKDMGPAIVLAAIGGLYSLLRIRSTRLSGVVVSLLLAVTVILRAVMGLDPFNPDYYGYLMPAFAVAGIGLAVFVAVAADVFCRAHRFGPILAAALGLGALALPVWKGRETRETVDLSSFCATRLYLDLALAQARPGTLALVSYYKPFFVFWSARYVDGSRPDVSVVNPELFGYPGYLAATLRDRPDLRELAWTMVVNGRITEKVVADLALSRPLRVEPDFRLDDAVSRTLLPDGVLYAASPEPLAGSDVAWAAASHLGRLEAFYADLGPAWREPETWRMLVWSHYLDALFLARRGAPAHARRAVEMLKALGCTARQVTDLERALAGKEKGALDIGPFLPLADTPGRPSARDDGAERPAG